MKTFEITSKNEFDGFAVRLQDAARAYYSGDGSQLMDDATYDAGIRALRLAQAANPEWGTAVLTEVAGGEGTGDVAHSAPMLSLDNAMDDDEVRAFISRFARLTSMAPEAIEWSVEPKLDGMALSAHYKDGNLVRVLTRGTGLMGEDVTEVARDAQGLPSHIRSKATLEVRGECVMTDTDFAVTNTARMAAGKTAFANARNGVAGILHTKRRGYAALISFLAYGAIYANSENATHSRAMDYVLTLGFTPARALMNGHDVVTGTDSLLAALAQVEGMRASLGVDIDGAVIKANDPALRAKAGEGSRAPRWAIARKFPPSVRATDLLDINVDVGRTGNLSFTAKVAPVFVGGATITSVTVHNPSQIATKGLRLPVDGQAQQVYVRRAGDVIPEIVGPVEGDTNGATFVPPVVCPRCGNALDKTNLVWRCSMGVACAVEAGIQYAVSRDNLDIDGMGERIVHSLVASGHVSDVADLFSLDLAALLTVDRLGASNARKILQGIERARALPMHRVLSALGIPMTGRSMSRRLARHFGSMPALCAASIDALREVESVETDRARSIREGLDRLGSVLDRLAALGIGQVENTQVASSELTGLTVVVSGSVPGMTRTQAQELVERLGGRASSSISANTSLLVAGPGAGSKVAKAQSLGVRVMSAEDFAALNR